MASQKVGHALESISPETNQDLDEADNVLSRPQTKALSGMETCSFDVNVHGFSGSNGYGYHADCYIYKVAWSSLRGPRYHSSKYYSGYSQFEVATFRDIPVNSKQTVRYKITVTYRAKYPSGYEKYFEVGKYANINPRDAGKWLKGWLSLKSWNIPIPAY